MPFHSEHFLFVEVGKYIHSRIEESNAHDAITDTNEHKSNRPSAELQPKHGVTKGALVKYAKWANNAGLVQMGIPFNRFIAFSASYFFFLLIIVTLIIKPIFVESYTTEQDLKHNTLLQWTNWHYLILFYILALLEKDFENFYRVKSVHRVLSNFWRVYDLIFHLFFLFYLILRMTLQLTNKMDDCIGMDKKQIREEVDIFRNDSYISNHSEFDCGLVLTTLSISGVLFAVGMHRL